MTPPLWQQAFVQWVRACVAQFDTPAPTHPATTPAAHVVRVILADQRDAPRPTNPNGGVAYCAIRFLTERSLGSLTDSAVWDEGEGELTTTRYDRREGTVSIGCYGPRAEELADAITMGVDDEDLIAPLASADVALGEEIGRVPVGVASGDVPDPRVVIDYRYRRTASSVRVTTGVVDHAALTFVPASTTPAAPATLVPDEDEAIDIIAPAPLE